MQVLVSLHDVSPAHQARVELAEALLARAGVARVAYLLVPDFHWAHPIAADRAFHAWCARPRPYAVDWVLHGYSHVDDGDATRRVGRPAWLKRRVLTNGEGEFLGLSAEAQRCRLRHGRRAAAFLGRQLNAFVAPAWLGNDALAPTLSGEGFRYTEDHLRVFDVAAGTSRRCPVITWATRTPGRRRMSPWWSRTVLRAVPQGMPLRVALHPHDMDHPSIVASISRVLDLALQTRSAAGHVDLFQ